MLMVIDLTPRQATRVLEQGLRIQARFEIEPRNRPADSPPLLGSLAGREGELLRVELHEGADSAGLTGLIGSFCEVRTTLSEQQYLFSSCILDAVEATTPQQLLLAVPESIQVANRRRYQRQNFGNAIQVKLWVDDSGVAYIGHLCDVSVDGLACRILRNPLDDLLLVGESVRAGFQIPSARESFELTAVVCSKVPTDDRTHLVVGLEFGLDEEGAATRQTLARLRAILCDMVTDSIQPGSNDTLQRDGDE